MDDDPHLLLLDAPLSRPAAEAAADAPAPVSPGASGRPVPSERQPVAALLERCEALRSREARLLLSLAVSAARFVACQGPGWMCYSSRADYAREQLGLSPARFGALVRAGQLLQDVPEIAAAMLQGHLHWSAISELTRLPTAGHVRALLDLACGRTAHEVRALVDGWRSELSAGESGDGAAGSAADSKRRTGADTDDRGVGACTAADARADASTDTGVPGRVVELDPLAEARYQAFALRMPPEVALYAEETLELARAVVGFDAPVDVALAAVVAEACERIDITVSAAEACRRFGVRPAEGTSRKATRDGAAGASTTRQAALRDTRAAAAMGQRTAAATGQPPAAVRTNVPAGEQLHALAQARIGANATESDGGTTSSNPSRAALWRLDPLHPTRRDAHRLDRWLRRQTARLQQAQAHLQDELLQLHLDNAPARLGYPGLPAMAADLLDFSPSTTWNYIKWARRRRADHPIAVAQAQGRVTDVQADLLEQLQSQAYVPASALLAWIDRAERCTVRKLRDMLAWARKQAFTDVRGWANAGYPPPDDQQLQTSSRLIEDIANDPTPPDPVPLILEAARARTVLVRWVLETGTLVALLQLMASLQDRIQRDYERETGELCPRPTPWWALLAVLVLARRGWAPLARIRSKRNHAILSRERFRCAAGGCSQRRGLEDHHLHYRGRGGSNARHNRACLCSAHHRLGEHGGILRVCGKAIPDARALRWQMALDPQGKPTRILRGDEILYDARRWRPRVSD